ncbi:MAG: hypothetical protein JW772_01725 [Candidatus Diapherotrites archaeon]|nr:hypothetical protein [Candidatus Diapherotrites archaeon]
MKTRGHDKRIVGYFDFAFQNKKTAITINATVSIDSTLKQNAFIVQENDVIIQSVAQKMEEKYVQTTATTISIMPKIFNFFML